MYTRISRVGFYILSIVFILGCTNSVEPNSFVKKNKPISNLPVKMYGLKLGKKIDLSNATVPTSSYMYKHNGVSAYSGRLLVDKTKTDGYSNVTYYVVPSTLQLAGIKFHSPELALGAGYFSCLKLKNRLIEGLYSKHGGNFFNEKEGKAHITTDREYMEGGSAYSSSGQTVNYYKYKMSGTSRHKAIGKLEINDIVFDASCSRISYLSGNSSQSYGGGTITVSIPLLMNQYKVEKKQLMEKEKTKDIGNIIQ